MYLLYTLRIIQCFNKLLNRMLLILMSYFCLFYSLFTSLLSFLCHKKNVNPSLSIKLSIYHSCQPIHLFNLSMISFTANLHSVCMYVRTYVRTSVRTYVRMYVRTYLHTYVRTYVRMYVCMYVYMYYPSLILTLYYCKVS